VQIDGKKDMQHLFDLSSDPFEQDDLLRKHLPPRPPELLAILRDLNQQMSALLASP
jgi:hypothetical protein